MNIKNLTLHVGLGFALAISGIVSQTPLAQAQSGNQSDVTGAIITTSDIAGGFNFSSDRRRYIAFRSAAIQDAVNTSAISINQQLVAGSLPIVSTDPTTTAISVTIQQNLQVILADTGNVDNSVVVIVNDLVNAGADRTLSQNFVYSLRGLTARGKVRAAKFQVVTRSYNTFIDNCSDQVFVNNPDSLRAIRAVLSIMLNAALASR
ncbi:MAG TPA: hypothetical protein V6D11_00090 [Waterburya sp.]|jgi:hypothetical protein